MVALKSEPMCLSSFSSPCCLHQHFTCVKQEMGECAPTRRLSSEWGGGDSGRIVGAPYADVPSDKEDKNGSVTGECGGVENRPESVELK